MLALSVIVCAIFSQDVHNLDLDIKNEPRSTANMLIEITHEIFYILAIIMLVLSVICEISAYELPNVLDLNP